MKNFYYSKDEFEKEINETGSKVLDYGLCAINNRYSGALIINENGQTKSVLILN
jgi:hypothetical protein